MPVDKALEEARAAMIAKRFGGNVNGARTGDGSRRKKKSVHKSGGGKIYTYIINKNKIK